MKTVFVDPPEAIDGYVDDVLTLENIAFSIYDSSPIDDHQIIERARNADVIVVDPSTTYTSHVLRELPRLRTIVTLSVDTHHVDKAYCKSRDITIKNFPGLNARGAAEAAITQASALRHGIPAAYDTITNKNSRTRARKLHGCTIGIIGAGHVGAELVRLATALDMTVLCHTRRATPERARSLGLRSFTSMRDVLSQSDIVVAAIGGAHDVKDAIDPTLLREMQADTVFVNIGQWDAADIHVLADMKYRGLLAGVAVDCSSPGPPPSLFNDILMQEFIHSPGVFLTPDLRTITEDERARLAHLLRSTLAELIT